MYSKLNTGNELFGTDIRADIMLSKVKHNEEGFDKDDCGFNVARSQVGAARVSLGLSRNQIFLISIAELLSVL